jgi:hypothetical protein
LYHSGGKKANPRKILAWARSVVGGSYPRPPSEAGLTMKIIEKEFAFLNAKSPLKQH